MARGQAVGAVRVDILASNAQFTKAIRESRTRLQRFRDTAIRIARRIARNWKQIGVAIAATAVSIGYSIKKMTDYSSSLVEASRTTGLTIKQLERMRTLFEGDGIGIKRTDKAMQEFNVRIGFAQRGIGQYTRAFEDLGVAVRRQDGSFKSQHELLGEVAEALKNTGSESRAASLAYELFGRSGKELLPILRRYGQELNRTAKEANRFNTLTDEQHETNKALGQSFLDWSKALRDLLNRALAPMAKPLKRIFDDWTDWVQELKNSPEFMQRLEDVFVKVATAIERISDAILNALDAIKGIDEIGGQLLDGNWMTKSRAKKELRFFNRQDNASGASLDLSNIAGSLYEGLFDTPVNVGSNIVTSNRASWYYSGFGSMPEFDRETRGIDYHMWRGVSRKRMMLLREQIEKAQIQLDDAAGLFSPIERQLLGKKMEGLLDEFEQTRKDADRVTKAYADYRTVVERTLGIGANAVEKSERPVRSSATEEGSTTALYRSRYAGMSDGMLRLLYGIGEDDWKPGDPLPSLSGGRDRHFDDEQIYNRAMLEAKKWKRIGEEYAKNFAEGVKTFAIADAGSMESLWAQYAGGAWDPRQAGRGARLGGSRTYRRTPNYGLGTRTTLNYGFPSIDPQMAFGAGPYNANAGFGIQPGTIPGGYSNSAWGGFDLDPQMAFSRFTPELEQVRQATEAWNASLKDVGSTFSSRQGLSLEYWQEAKERVMELIRTKREWRESVESVATSYETRLAGAQAQWKAGLLDTNDALQDAKGKTNELRSAFDQMGSSIVDNFQNAGEALRQFARDLVKIGWQRLVLNPVGNALFGASDGSTEGVLGGFFNDVFPPGGAAAGMGARSVTIVNNISSTDGPGVRAALAEATPGIVRHAESTIMDNANRYGQTQRMIRGTR